MNTFLLLLAMLCMAACNNLRGQVWMGQSVATDGGIDVIGFVVGPLLFFLSFVVIWSNERKAALDSIRLNILRQLLNQDNSISIEKSSVLVEKLVYVCGEPTVDENLLDPISGFTASCISVRRTVEVLEYREFSGKTELMWCSENVPSVGTHVNDEGNWVVKSEQMVAEKVKIGHYWMSPSQKLLFEGQWVQPTVEQGEAVKGKLGWGGKVEMHGNYIYVLKPDADTTTAGALRIGYQVGEGKQVSIICGVEGQQLEPFSIQLYHNKGRHDRNGCCGGHACCFVCNCTAELLKPMSDIDWMVSGKVEADAIVQSELKAHTWIMNLLRVVAFVMMVGGLYFLFWPITDMTNSIPIVGGWLKGTINSMIFAGSCIVGIPLYVINLSLAWLCYHPRKGLPCIIVGLSLMVGLIVIALVD